MSDRRPRVLVVDDSAFARRVMREVLAADGRVDVVGYARDGLDALEKIEELAPDVITLDLVMPELDGVGVLEALKGKPNAPRVIVVSISAADGPLGVAALAAGAFDLVQKPTALATDRLYDLRAELVAKVLAAAGAIAPRATTATLPTASSAASREEPLVPVPSSTRTRLVVIGASTGGPRAIALLLRALPASFPAPIAIVVHMPPGYTEAFAQRLDGESALTVSEARTGAILAPGTATIARAGMHLHVQQSGGELVAALDVRPTNTLHRPCVDRLFVTATEAVGAAALGVILTGMGTDGLEGARALRNAGGVVLAEAASSCVVYGMPRAVVDAGLATGQVPLEDMARAIAARL